MVKGVLVEHAEDSCKNCNELYRKSKRYQLFCSTECRMTWHRGNITCPHCGKSFAK